jgi:hypothetical protein
MAKLDVFVPPQSWPAFSKAMSWVNRIVMLHGIPILRDIPVLKRIPGIRGLTDIRTINVNPDEVLRLKTLCESGAATFIVPNHPEFFTDWMIDKEIIARCCPNAASWATNGVVNGMGNAMQKFWLWNNLIAQIPGDSSLAKTHSIQWALKGQGVLLHPEGSVGWHSNYVAPLMSGAADMALEAKRLAPEKPVYLVPVVWKLEFVEDATAALARECSYVESKLSMTNASHLNPAARVYAIYDALMLRDLDLVSLKVSAEMPALKKRRVLEQAFVGLLTHYLGKDGSNIDIIDLIKQVRKKVRTEPQVDNAQAINPSKLCDRLQRVIRLGDFAGKSASITQEEVAEHLKRLRNDWCKGSFKDTLNAYLPQPAARRTAHLRILEPVEVKPNDDAKHVMATLRSSMQDVLGEINTQIDVKGSQKVLGNPFFVQSTANS